MLIRFSVENFLSFDLKQELTMIPAKRSKSKLNKNHIASLGKVSLLRAATIYGANASGKTNLIQALRFAKRIITQKIPADSAKMFCRAFEANKNKESRFEFEIFKNGKFYAYGFSLHLQDQKIVSEWLYELFPQNSPEKMLFEREVKKNRLELGPNVKLNETDKMRFKTYKLDFEENNHTLFVQEMNRNKKMNKDSMLSFFREVYEWFNDDLIIIFPDQPITNFEYFYGEGGNKVINQIIEVFDTGISKVKVKKIPLTEFNNNTSDGIAQKMIEIFRERLEDSEKGEVEISVRSQDTFYNIKGNRLEDPTITTIMLEHGNAFSDFEFSEESDGTRRLFDLLDILISRENNKVYVIDEMERSLHPKLTYKFLEMFFKQLEERNTQLIFTTHESTIMDQNLLRRDEIWFVERDNSNTSHLYSLDRFKERYDKKLSKAYLEGRYGAVPIFKEFSFKDGEFE